MSWKQSRPWSAAVICDICFGLHCTFKVSVKYLGYIITCMVHVSYISVSWKNHDTDI